LRTTRVVLAAAHLDSDPANNRLRNLRALCQRRHMCDRPYQLAQRWITYRRRLAICDLFLGPWNLIATLTPKQPNVQTCDSPCLPRMRFYSSACFG
jgi:hypothetical protein